MTIQLPDNVASALAGGMETRGAIELPFSAPVFWTINGDARLAGVGARALYFGGWAVDAEQFSDALQNAGLAMPTFLEPGVITNERGDAIDILTTRAVLVAPIGMRHAWLVANPGGQVIRSAEFVQGGRQHVQVLCFAGQKIGDQYQPWGPIVLSAKGFQANNLKAAFTAWEKRTAPARKKYAPNVPAWCFYAFLGTFGDKRQQEMVGKNQKSPITPIGVWLPEEKNVTEELLGKLFVGESIASQMVAYLDLAREWLDAWRQPMRDQLYERNDGNGNGNGRHKTNGNNNGNGTGRSQPYYVPEPPPDYSDEIPF